ncbi:MAG: hypothetical protein ACLRMW_09195 [[Clostridium] symbiosum]
MLIVNSSGGDRVSMSTPASIICFVCSYKYVYAVIVGARSFFRHLARLHLC